VNSAVEGMWRRFSDALEETNLKPIVDGEYN
jgi:hypothetical protein